MLVALGECYERLDRHVDAMKCYWKAHCVGDIEGGIALFQLATMYDKTGDCDQAAAAYHQYIVDTEDQGISDRDQQSKAYRYLAQYYIKQGLLDHAYQYAQKCTEFTNTKEAGKCFIKEIAALRIDTTNSKTDSVAKDQPSVRRDDPLERVRQPYGGNSPRFADNEDPPRLEPQNLTFTP